MEEKARRPPQLHRSDKAARAALWLHAAGEVGGLPKTMKEFLRHILSSNEIEWKDGQMKRVGQREMTPLEVEGIWRQAGFIFQEGAGASNMAMWVLGNIAYILKDYDNGIDSLIETTDCALNTIQSARRTFEFFKDQRYDCSFTHHKEVAHMRHLSADIKHALIKYAAAEGWSVATMRTVARFMQNIVKQGGELDKDDIDLYTNDALTTTPATKLRTYIVIPPDAKGITTYTGAEPPKVNGFIGEIARVIQKA